MTSQYKKDSKENEERDTEYKGLIGDAIKKILTVGVGAAFMTEDAIRGYLSELKLPKDILSLLLQNASKSKDEITQRVTKEIINIVKNIDIVSEASRFVEDHKFKISAEIEIIKKNSTNNNGEPPNQSKFKN